MRTQVVDMTAAEKNEADQPCAKIILYRANGSDCQVPIEELAQPHSDQDLLWVDIDFDMPDVVAEVCQKLEVPAGACRHLSELGSTPILRHYGKFLVIHAVAAEHIGSLKFDGIAIAIAAGKNVIITVHRKSVPFIHAIREREHGETMLGLLTAPSFVASLLDWHLDTYFEAVSDFEVAVERLEESILDGRQDESTRDLIVLRRGASRLRRMLAPHRTLFSGLTRPDFEPEDDEITAGHFRRLEDHFEIAMDSIEHARELVIGSFELFSNQIALRTNGAMRLLTFATVVIGCQTVIAGVLGMNFKASLFDTATFGFWASIACMAAVTGIAVWLGKKRNWF
jgi:magnesium transporter